MAVVLTLLKVYRLRDSVQRQYVLFYLQFHPHLGRSGMHIRKCETDVGSHAGVSSPGGFQVTVQAIDCLLPSLRHPLQSLPSRSRGYCLWV